MLMTMLRSIKEIHGYDMHTTDSKIGMVEEFYICGLDWFVTVIGMKAEPALGEGKVYVPANLLEEVDSDSKCLYLQLNREEFTKQLSDMRLFDRSKHLHPVKKLLKFKLIIQEQEAGLVEDILLNDADLAVRYLVVDIPGLNKKVLISPWRVKKIDWKAEEIHLDADREEISQSPEYNFTVPIPRDYENSLNDYYKNHPYWA